MKIIRNIVAVIVGLLVGGALNMALVMLGPKIIPPPEGAVITTMEGLKAAMPFMEPKHFLFPFLAHALGTLVGAILTALIAASHRKRLELSIGIFSLVGGIMNIIELPGSPLWFTIVDLTLAYIPMAYIGGRLINKD